MSKDHNHLLRKQALHVIKEAKEHKHYIGVDYVETINAYFDEIQSLLEAMIDE